MEKVLKVKVTFDINVMTLLEIKVAKLTTEWFGWAP